jgi:predicted ATPase
VPVIGQPGVGKSRLVYEFTHPHRLHGWLHLASHSVSYGKASPYLPVIELLKGYFGIEPQDDARRRREQATGKLLTLDRALEPVLPAVLALLDVPVEDAQWQALDPPQRRRQTFEAIRHLLIRESQVQPVLVMCEDLHWLDAETQALLHSLVESLPTTRIVLLITYRPEYRHGWGAKTYYTQLRLNPLPPVSAHELLHALLGNDLSLAPLMPLLVARTEGNPFFLEESVRTLVETGVLVGTPGAYHLAQAVPSIQVPPTVQAVLAARIDRLPPAEKRLLQTAAVIGADIPFCLLQAIVDLPEATLHRGLAHFQAVEFLHGKRSPGVPSYAAGRMPWFRTSGVGSQDGARSPRSAASQAAVTESRTLRCCCCRMATTVISASTQRQPSALWVPKLPLRQRSPGRIARSAALLVGSTSS